jgi:hypothetical protein
VRGFTLAQKPFTMSFDDWWHGINPILNLGLAPEKTAGSPALDVIRVEQKSYFYDKTSTSINLDYVNNIERSYDFDSVFKMIELGYEEWAVESDNGLDDPQTKHTYNTRFKTVGKELSILSKFIGAALAIEETRRETDLKKDYRMDEKILIIALNENSSPVKPEMGIDFASVSNLLNPNTRYNIRISVARNFERWKDYFNGCLQWYVNSPGTEYLFAKGEGNLDMTSVLWGGGCESIFPTPDPVISEKQNIEATSDFLFMPIKYSFEHYLTWDQYKTIRDNRNKAIGVSRSNLGHVKCFVDELEYEITTGKTSFTVWLGENNPIV